MRVLVTGARGYVGGAAVEALRDAGHEPVPFAGDVLDPPAVRDAVAGADGVVHLAALSRVREAVQDPERCHRVNVGGTEVVLDALDAEAGRRGTPLRLVLASSAAVYGRAREVPIPETAAVAPLGPYAASKAGAERAVATRAGDRLGAVVLRIFNVAGAAGGRGDRDGTRLVPRVLAVAAGAAPHLEVLGDGRAMRDYVHVRDVGDALALALDAARPGAHAVLNVGATPASVLDVVAAAERVTGRPVPVVHRPGDPGEAPDLRADTAAARAALGWSPRRSGLDELLAGQWAVTGGAESDQAVTSRAGSTPARP
jgi:UDP-glucose 4-epimerase